ncbi:MAG: replication-associated recombination protein A [Thermodesulfobacteriota bacterium]|nr:replication-associated recombination protein A [Thermodesulfobacteriota bacterium]
MENRRPLAERMRPQSLDEIAGQENLLGKGKLLESMLGSDILPSLILWGPPGTGKTTLARILARSTSADFVYFSAVLSGVKEVRNVVEQAKKIRDSEQRGTIFFIDEIHRFNKSQQDAFLPHVENGLFTLIGATTENPSFQVIAPLLSRCRILVLNSLSKKHLRIIFQRALDNTEQGLGNNKLTFDTDSLELLAGLADGDARKGLNTLEIAAALVLHRNKTAPEPSATITPEDISEAAQQTALRYDKDGEEHYNLISALHKSLRDSDPDGSLYWLYRMLESGEDPLYICRRLIRFASEDIGLSDPQALIHTISCRDAYHTLGLPEGKLALAQAVSYLATAPKSNSMYKAESEVRKCIRSSGTLPVPLHLRNAPTQLMKDLNYGKNYKYAHDADGALVAQDHLPPEINKKQFYFPTTRGYEALVKDRLKKWQTILKQKKNNA